MLRIKNSILLSLEAYFLSKHEERGALLGYSDCSQCVDCVKQIPSLRSGVYYYEPDHNEANRTIRNWADKGIRFCGFIHSHVIPQYELSEEDILFLKKLIHARNGNVIFGLGVVNNGKVEFRFYQGLMMEEAVILPIDYAVVF